MTLVRKMHADLVLAPRLQLYLNERSFRGSLQDSHVGHREFSNLRVGSGVDAVGRVLCEKRADRELVLANAAFDNGKVPATGAVILKLMLQPLLTVHCFRKDQQPRGFPI